jgi:hypothetical protein
MITDVTTDGTVSCLAGTGPTCRMILFGVIDLTGLPYGVGPQTEENHGAVSGVVLFSESGFVPPNGSLVVAKVRVSARFPEVEGEETSGRIFFATRTGESGDSVSSVVRFPSTTRITVDSGDPPLQVIDCPVTFRAVTPTAGFIRCDPNDDGLIDIADPIWILNELFTGGPATPCREAADCNADGAIDLADAAYGITYQFLGGPPPPAPFPRCGRLPGLPPESCPAGSTRCP